MAAPGHWSTPRTKRWQQPGEMWTGRPDVDPATERSQQFALTAQPTRRHDRTVCASACSQTKSGGETCRVSDACDERERPLCREHVHERRGWERPRCREHEREQRGRRDREFDLVRRHGREFDLVRQRDLERRSRRDHLVSRCQTSRKSLGARLSLERDPLEPGEPDEESYEYDEEDDSGRFR